MNESSPAPSRWRTARRWLGALAGVTGLASLLGAGLLGFLYQRDVVSQPGPHLDPDHIRAIISEETPVYYSDGSTPLGVFFADEHRVYVGWDELPRPYVMAIVAAEDGTFWTHGGVSLKHLVRAMVANAKAGTVVAGGSTLTQQTAKNLYYRPDRSLRSKGVELVNALRLEAHYDKSDILTFYANQFHVSGNGRGLGIAARYFFDRDVSELSVLECAFLAGLVKAPSYYDPFIGDEARRARSIERAHDRTRYVLQRLLDEDPAHLAVPGEQGADAQVERVRAEAQRLLDEGFELPFTRGTFRYDSSAVLDEVQRRLEEPPFDTLFDEAGISDLRTSGLRIVTTLDADAQREATYGLWHHLTELAVQLEALGPADFIRAESRGPRFDPDRPVHDHEFRLARITGHPAEPKPHLALDLGGPQCVVDRDGVIRAALAWHRGQLGDRYAKVPSATINAFIEALPVDSVVLVSVRDGAAGLCDLELHPELQGAAVVLDDGRIRAMVGGNDGRNFNRVGALRQLGSTFKPVLYAAALRLGFQPTDVLDNRRNVFAWSTSFYYPRPDHDPADEVSMAWAGVNSENLASIWLLYHLTDRLELEQVRRLADELGLARGEDESLDAYKLRIQKAGVLPLPSRVREALFMDARREVASGLAFSGHPEDELALWSLNYGWGYDRERTRVSREGPQSRAIKTWALTNSWLHLESRMETCAEQYKVLAEAVETDAVPAPGAIPDLSGLIEDGKLRVGCGALAAGYGPIDEELLAQLEPLREVEEALPEEEEEPEATGLLGRIKQRLQKRRKLLEGPADELPEAGGLPLGPLDDLLIDDRMHYSTLVAMERAVRRRELVREAAGESAPGIYDPEVLYWHQDFRVLLALRYVAHVARLHGVQTELVEALSLPLGASEVTIEEMTLLYEGLLTSQATRFPGEAGGREVSEPAASTLFIQRILDVDGNVLYEAGLEREEVAPPVNGWELADILHNTVLHGTGQRARSAIVAGEQVVPVGGKTGTTNDFRNSAFVGMVPGFDGEAWSVDKGYALGVYVGYDDNRSMTHGNLRVAGSSGALPAWIGAAQGLAAAGLLGDPPPPEPEVDPWQASLPRGLRLVDVDADAGLPLPPAEAVEEGAMPVEAPELAQVAVVRESSPLRRYAPPLPDRPRRVHVPMRTEEAHEVERRRRAEERPSVWDQP